MTEQGADRRHYDSQIKELVAGLSAATANIANLNANLERIDKKMELYFDRVSQEIDDVAGIAKKNCEMCAPNKYLKWILVSLVVLTVGMMTGPDNLRSLVEKLIFKLV